MERQAANSAELGELLVKTVSILQIVSMAVHIELDRPHAYFTNLDFITGRVVLATYTEETISAVNVKLESESRTRLAAPPRGGPGYQNDRSQTEMEVHKVSK